MRTLWRRAVQSVYIPLFDMAEDTLRTFSASGKVLFLFFSALLVTSAAALLFILNSQFLVATPARGGSLSEGIVGTPRFINPLLAISDADRDISALVYSGLLRATTHGEYIPDLAESYTVSPDGKTYVFVLKTGTTFHDGTPVTADDVVFTINKTQDATLKSPLRANWDGVGVQKIDDRTVQFVLQAPYAPFIENATLGILPKHLWQYIKDDEMPFSELNFSPVGSGPYKIESIARTAAGIPSSYTLSAFDAYALGSPYLTSITMHFYQNEEDVVDALRRNDIDTASGVSPAVLDELKDFNIVRSPLNRVFAVFFNQNQSVVLRDLSVRRALNDAIDKNALVAHVLGGYGSPLDGPLPPNTPIVDTTHPATSTDTIARAKKELIKAGWTLGAEGIFEKTIGGNTIQLAFTLTTGNIPELRAAAEYVRAEWKKAGANVTVQIYDQGDLSQNVIRPRKYEALLFGEVIGRELDLFAFWDSSQRIDPGLNVALYANSVADHALEQLRQVSDPAERQEAYQQFLNELHKDIPAVFLYAPDFVYIVPKDVAGLDLGFIETPSDRFLSVAQWHRETEYVWPLFVR